jgi:hypothetical protein
MWTLSKDDAHALMFSASQLLAKTLLDQAQRFGIGISPALRGNSPRSYLCWNLTDFNTRFVVSTQWFGSPVSLGLRKVEFQASDPIKAFGGQMASEPPKVFIGYNRSDRDSSDRYW